MIRRHADLRKIGYHLHGDAFEEVTPKLQSRLSRAAVAETGEESEDEGADDEEDVDGVEDPGDEDELPAAVTP